MTWPSRSKGQDEQRWYREVEKHLVLSVISADPEPGACSECGVRRTRFQCQSFPSRHIISLCKDCARARAASSAGLWVRSEAALRQKWERDGKDPAKQDRTKALWRARDGGRRASSPDPALAEPAAQKAARR